MREVKTPKKPLIYYYALALLILSLLNFFVMPWLAEKQVKEVDYGTFMTMTEDKDVGQVEVQENRIVFTNKDNTKIYKTGVMNDPDLKYMYSQQKAYALTMLPARTRPRKISRKSSIIFTTRANTRKSALPCQRVFCL